MGQRDVVSRAAERLGALALVHDRPDLAEAAEAARKRLATPVIRVVVMGEFKKGKSSLVNALLDAPVCAVDDDIATAARLEIGHGDQPAARVWRRGGPDDEVERSDVPIERAGPASTDATVSLVRATLPRQLLRRGIVLVDTPGVGGIASATAVVTASTLADAHAVLFVTDVSQELTRTEVEAIADAAERCPHLAVVETKIDLYPHWRDVVEADGKHLVDRDLDVPVVAVSNVLRRRALAAEDRALNEESGFPALVSLIVDRYGADARTLAVDGALHTVRRVYAQLHEPLLAQLRATEAAVDETAGPVPEVDAAREALATYRQRAAGWQQVLGDGTSDMASAVELDLRERFRTLFADAEAAIEESDPDQMWAEFEPDLYRRTAEALDANLTLLREHAEDLAARLAAALDDEYGELSAIDSVLGGELELDTAERRTEDGGSSGARAHQAFRAGYGGAMPIMAVGGMALGVLGLGTLVLPLAAVAGVVAGRRALTDERDRRLNQRRQQARVAVKKYLDDASFRAAAERKQAQRRVQRLLRDHYGARVKELGATHQQRVVRVEAAVAATAEDRRRQLAGSRDELARLEAVATDMAEGR